ncbi:ATP12 family chaperone protein [Roseospira goensis]|uniref:Chaperone required for assembly of F1-ATPase n=1 Tax=Roseospira goensis TaxID=391922 RepID=A0A7W6RZQ3_9PROT|nr:ATP12 family protein [Roseospira goensis]MBB4286046.1 chaperone required for assembly of F1-ATPase [Roseospira goensis]
MTQTAAPAPAAGPHRFYASAAPGPVDGGHGVFLDGRPVRTPSRAVLCLPTAALAAAVADEWQAQDDTINPHAMPLTQLANTTLERVAPDRAGLRAELLRYVDADLLCYRADSPAELAARQAAQWQPLLDWAESALSARLAVTAGVMPLRQTTEAAAALDAAFDALDDWALTAAQSAAAASGSLVLALALAHGRVDGETGFALSRLDETWQMEQWGADREALRAREAVRRDLIAAETLVRLTRG